MHLPAHPRTRPGRACAALACLIVASVPAAATVFKCAGPNNAPVYQDGPCPKGKELRDFDKDPPTVSVMPLVAPSPGVSPAGTAPGPSGTAAPPGKTKSASQGKPATAQASRPSERKFLAPGINEGEVVARVGLPDVKSGGNGPKTARWTYLPAPEDPGTITTLTFEKGRLVEVERKPQR